MIPHAHTEEEQAAGYTREQMQQHVLGAHPTISAGDSAFVDHHADHLRAEREVLALSGHSTSGAAVVVPMESGVEKMQEVLAEHIAEAVEELGVPAELVTGGPTTAEAVQEYEAIDSRQIDDPTIGGSPFKTLIVGGGDQPPVIVPSMTDSLEHMVPIGDSVQGIYWTLEAKSRFATMHLLRGAVAVLEEARRVGCDAASPALDAQERLELLRILQSTRNLIGVIDSNRRELPKDGE